MLQNIPYLKYYFIITKISIISLNTVLKSALRKDGLYSVRDKAGKKKHKKEGVKIMPAIPFINKVYDNLFFPLKHALKGLNNNVCFLNIDNKYDTIKNYCDWCSICNGILETAKTNIIANHELIKLIDFNKLKKFSSYLDFILIDRKETTTQSQINEWCKTTFGKVTDELYLFSEIFLKAELIELKWCPFKRSKEFYYRNKDSRFLEPTPNVIYEVGKILSQHETITCNNCPKIINNNWKYSKSNTKSIFQPLLNYMLNEINT